MKPGTAELLGLLSEASEELERVQDVLAADPEHDVSELARLELLRRRLETACIRAREVAR
jgi:hypothetical protein